MSDDDDFWQQLAQGSKATAAKATDKLDSPVADLLGNATETKEAPRASASPLSKAALCAHSPADLLCNLLDGSSIGCASAEQDETPFVDELLESLKLEDQRLTAASARTRSAVESPKLATRVISPLNDEEQLTAEISKWSYGREKNLIALLVSLDKVLLFVFDAADFQLAPIELSNVLTPAQTKVAYTKAITKLHPDKLPGTVTELQREAAQQIFAILRSAWESYKAENALQ